MSELNLIKLGEIMAMTAPCMGLLSLKSGEFFATESMGERIALPYPYHYEAFKASMNNWLGEAGYLERMVQSALVSKSKQLKEHEVIVRGGSEFYQLSVNLVIWQGESLIFFGMEDQSAIQRERQAFKRLGWLSEQLLKQVSSAFIKAESICETACKMSVMLIGKSDMGSFVRLKDGYLSFPTLVGYDDLNRKTDKLRFEDSLQWLLSKDAPHEALRIDDLNDLPEILPLMFDRSETAKTRSMISTPVHLEGQILGYLNVDSTIPKCFDDYDLSLLKQFAMTVEHALERNALLTRIQESETRDKQMGLRTLPLAELRVYDLMNKNPQRPALGLVLIDLMGLSIINDRYGWNMGNEAIIATGKQLALMDNDDCEVYRLSADQFLLISVDQLAYDKVCRSMDYTLKRFYTEGVALSKGRVHIPVIYVTDYMVGELNSLREILSLLRQKMRAEKDTWRLKMPIF